MYCQHRLSSEGMNPSLRPHIHTLCTDRQTVDTHGRYCLVKRLTECAAGRFRFPGAPLPLSYPDLGSRAEPATGSCNEAGRHRAREDGVRCSPSSRSGKGCYQQRQRNTPPKHGKPQAKARSSPVLFLCSVHGRDRSVLLGKTAVKQCLFDSLGLRASAFCGRSSTQPCLHVLQFCVFRGKEDGQTRSFYRARCYLRLSTAKIRSL